MQGTSRAFAAEAIGSALLLCVVVGSGIMAERLSAGNVALALLANSIATGAALGALITSLGPISGAHFNPVVTAVQMADGRLSARHAPGYVCAQLAGACAGVVMAHLMFDEPLVTLSSRSHAGMGQMVGEVIATFGLVTLIACSVSYHPSATPLVVAGYITAAYWFTSSTSFANPAVTLARALTDTFAGIRLLDVPGFVAAQCLGAFLAWRLTRWLVPPAPVSD